MKSRFQAIQAFLAGTAALLISSAAAAESQLAYRPAPPDNPLKGFVPYVESDGRERFPHSLQFQYFALRDLMTDSDEFDWSPIEEKLETVRKRGCQLILRVYLEYPRKPVALPRFLIDEGVKMVSWEADGAVSHTPDYEDARLQLALESFITAFGAKYDGDPRIGYITAGLLGSWGEWHTHPRSDLWASHEAQRIVLDAYEAAFRKTPVLLRYPASVGNRAQAPNAERPFGYHDDSFGWATLETERPEDQWFFASLLRAAGADQKWKTQPIGGEVRPELWERNFTDDPHPNAQDFDECVRETHVTWLMDSGLSSKRFPLDEQRNRRAARAAQRMGYEFHISRWRKKGGRIEIEVENRGVAPFYHDWPVEFAAGDEVWARFDLRGILPGESRRWTTEVSGKGPYRLRVPNPMEGGKPLRFANLEQGEDWLTLPDSEVGF